MNVITKDHQFCAGNKAGRGLESEAVTGDRLGTCCELLRPVTDHDGRSRFRERPLILREINNLGRRMFLVRFDDGATTFVFPNEVAIRGC
jgi:hypothetical protein